MKKSRRSWALPPRDPVLAPDSVHVWFLDARRRGIALDGSPKRSIIPEHEWHDFVLGNILEKYHSVVETRARLERKADGRPFLSPEMGIRLSLSDKETCLVVALALNRDVGVDVEEVSELPEASALAERFFTRSEFEKLGILSGKRLLSRFFELWTAKEAIGKMTGEGINSALGNVEIPTQPSKSVWINVRKGVGGANFWIRHMYPSREHVICIAVPGSQPRLRLWRCQPSEVTATT